MDLPNCCQAGAQTHRRGGGLPADRKEKVASGLGLIRRKSKGVEPEMVIEKEKNSLLWEGI